MLQDEIVGVEINGVIYIDTFKNLSTPMPRTPVERYVDMLTQIVDSLMSVTIRTIGTFFDPKNLKVHEVASQGSEETTEVSPQTPQMGTRRFV